MVCGVGVRRGVAWGVRFRAGGGSGRARVAFPAHALPAQAMRLTANQKKTVTVDTIPFLVDTNLGSAHVRRALDSRIKKKCPQK